MVVHAQDVRNATNAAVTVIQCAQKVRCVVSDHYFDDKLHRYGPMLTNHMAVYFAAMPLVSKAVDRLRAVSIGPKVIGKHSAASYHELALCLGEELIWHMYSGMSFRCLQVVPGVLSGFDPCISGVDPFPDRTILAVQAALDELGGIEDPSAAIAELREHSLTSYDIQNLRSCVLNEGALAAAENKHHGPSYLNLAIEGESLTRGDTQVFLTGNGLRLVALLHNAGGVGVSHRQLTETVFDSVVTRNAFDQLVAAVRKKLAPLGLTLEARTRGIWTLVEAANIGHETSLSKD